MAVNIKIFQLIIFLCFGFSSRGQERILGDSVTISPNPATEYIIIETGKHPTNAAFVNDQGLIQGFIPIRGPRTMLDIQRFSPGKYYILMDGESYRFIKK